MTVYVFDSSPLIDLFRHFYPARFPSLWERFDDMVASGRIISTREVHKELERHGDRLSQWCKQNASVFAVPTGEELGFVAEIFRVPHFQTLIDKKRQLAGGAVADPFVIARARCAEGCVVTGEKHKPNAGKIPNVCEHFGIEWTDLEGFMEREGWVF